MSATKPYLDSDGRWCDLPTMCTREPAWACGRIISLMTERNAAHERLEALVAAIDAQVSAALEGDGREEAEAAFAKAMAAARGAL
jgi:hypothetical protein